LGRKSTVFFSRSASISAASAVSRASVYRIAAGASPSMLPKFPCPSTSGYRITQLCAMRTSVG
jgi:hypothetical protein